MGLLLENDAQIGSKLLRALQFSMMAYRNDTLLAVSLPSPIGSSEAQPLQYLLIIAGQSRLNLRRTTFGGG